MPIVFSELLKKQHTQIDKSLSTELIREDRKELIQYFFSLKRQGRLNPEMEKLFRKYKNLFKDEAGSDNSLIPIVKAGSKENPHDTRDNGTRFKIISPLDLEKIRSLFEQKYFLKAQSSFKPTGTKLIKYIEKHFFLTKFNAEVLFSMVVSRSGDLEIFLIDCERQPESNSVSENGADVTSTHESSALEQVFFLNIAKVLNASAITDFFFSVFDLNLGNKLEYSKGEFGFYASRVMYRIWLKGMVSFYVLVDQELNLIDLFSPNKVEPLKKAIVKLIKLKDSKLELNLKKS